MQKRVIRKMTGLNLRMTCQQLFKKIKMLTLASLYILDGICFVKNYCQCLELNSKVHKYYTQRKMDIHIQS
jgi:hypothetical protein